METVLGFIVIGLGLYFIPTFVACGNRNQPAIFALNLLLGWSLIGWAIALVWALCKDAPKSSLVNQYVANIGPETEVTEPMKQHYQMLVAQDAKQRFAELNNKWVWF